MKAIRFTALLLTLATLLTACALPGPVVEVTTEASIPTTEPTLPETQPTTQPPTEPVTEPQDPILQLLDTMTLREKVGQLFIVRPDSLDPSQSLAQISDSGSVGVTEVTSDLAAMLKEYPVGGVVMFAKNLTSPQQITQLNSDLQAESTIPLFIAVDEEGGLVARLANHKAFDLPKFKNAASITDADSAFDLGATIGGYLSQYGFNLDFAPVADVNTNPDNPIIGTRAFSSLPEEAALLCGSCADGLRSTGITPTFKHFPGHGDTAEDSHTGIAITYRTAEEMAACEWIPFEEATASDCIMVGHIATPSITGDLTPASLSYQLVTQILREELGFSGLIVTDALEMGAITDSYTSGQAALAALNAGCDLLLMPYDLTEAFDAVVEAVENGTYPEESLNRTVERILRFKQSQGLDLPI